MSAARPGSVAAEPRPAKIGLSPLQVMGSALAAATSAVVASFFGVAGTVIGAALASVITTVSATVYSNSLRKTNERLRELTARRTGRRPTTTQVLPRRPATRDLPAALNPRRAPARPRRFYVRLAAGAAAVFVAAMVIVTGVELIGQKPVSAMVTGSSSRGTTVGDLTNAGSQKPAPSSSTPAPGTSTPTTAPATPSGTSEPTAMSSSSSSAARTSSASATPSATTPATSSAAATSAPQDSATPTP